MTDIDLPDPPSPLEMSRQIEKSRAVIAKANAVMKRYRRMRRWGGIFGRKRILQEVEEVRRELLADGVVLADHRERLNAWFRRQGNEPSPR